VFSPVHIEDINNELRVVS